MVVVLSVNQRSRHTMDKVVFNRLLDEARELQEKIDSLHSYIQKNAFLDLSLEDQYLLTAQLGQMSVYLCTLRRRIFINRDKVEE